ncbi:amidohydrolase family protein [Acidobacteria bacterium AH-259-L09]|nr:amidohydrolase family protein [Acidobacteria bacterium AH-259-L09]
MKPLIKLFLVLVTTILAACASPEIESPSVGTSVVAFTDVNVVPMNSERVLEAQTVIVGADRIIEIGPAASVEVPGEAVLVDGTGKYLMPGFAEMHGHIPSPDAPYIESVLFLYISNGVTTVRGMAGRPNQLELREEVKGGKILAPTLYLAGPGLSGNSIDSPTQAAERVREQKAAGWDFIKVYPGLTREEYDAMAQTAREVGIPFVGHVPSDAGLAHALEMGQETIDHLDGYIEYLNGDSGPVEEAKLAQVVRRTREAGAGVVPTMVLWETILGVADLETLRTYPELRFMPPQQVERWVEAYRRRISGPQFDKARVQQIATNRNRLLKAVSDGGIRILFGTDSPQQFSVPGFSIHRELQHMVRVGMTPYEIIRSGTKNVGEYFKDQDRFGTIEVGARADLILLEANPLEDVGNIAKRAGVMVRGQWLPELEIQARLEEIAASYQQGVRP